MKKVAECDAETLYLALDKIGINMKALDMSDPNLEYLRELYGFLLRMQVCAWKAGKTHRGIIQATNDALIRGRSVQNIIAKSRQP